MPPGTTSRQREDLAADGKGTKCADGRGGTEERGEDEDVASWDWLDDDTCGDEADVGDLTHEPTPSEDHVKTRSTITPTDGDLSEDALNPTNCDAGEKQQEVETPTPATHPHVTSTSPPRPLEEREPPSPSKEAATDAKGGFNSEPAAKRPFDSKEKEDERMCRICFAGPEDEATCGRLISPCKCRGTMRYVHLGCLNSWRRSSGKNSSFFRCDQCQYKYSFSRTTYARWATNEFVILLTSLLVFLVLVVLSGYMMKLLFYFFPSWFTLPTLDVPSPLHSADDVVDVVDEELEEYWELLRLLHSASSSLSSFSVDALHMVLGFVLVGVLGFFQVMLAILAHGGGFFWNGGGARDRDGFGVGLLIAVVVIGGLRALWDVYKLVRWFARSGLERLEEVILEVHE